jgi:methyltransferase (TIGR00027 family)
MQSDFHAGLGMTDSPIRDVSDTAYGVAIFRAQESERPDALFHDPYARRLAGAHGEAAAQALVRLSRSMAKSIVLRTALIDTLIEASVATAGIDGVLNLAAGLDTRPYRLALPPTLQWIEVDQAPVQAHKSAILANDTPRCALRRLALDLTDRPARRALFAEAGASARRILVLTEGLLVYLEPDEVQRLAEDLAAVPAMRLWVTDLITPVILKILQNSRKGTLDAAPPRFAPANGAAFFAPMGWAVAEQQALLDAGLRLKRDMPSARILRGLAKVLPLARRLYEQGPTVVKLERVG